MKHLFSLFVLLLTCIFLNAQSTLLIEDFEDNTLTFSLSTPLFSDGDSDYFTIVPLNGDAMPGDPYTGFSGSNYFAVEDMDDGGTKPNNGTLTFVVDITGYESLNFSGLFAAGGNGETIPTYDDEESVIVTASIDGNPIQNLFAIEAFEPGGDITNNQVAIDTDFDGIGDGVVLSSALTEYGSAITGTGTSLTLEIAVISTDGGSEFAFDEIKVTGSMEAPPVDPIPTMGQWSLFILALMMSSLALAFMATTRRAKA